MMMTMTKTTMMRMMIIDDDDDDDLLTPIFQCRSMTPATVPGSLRWL
jgi:hypothetical protein